MRQVKKYITNSDLCEILGVELEEGQSFGDIEVFYRPDAEMWLVTGKVLELGEETD